jgi:hypothetical protein
MEALVGGLVADRDGTPGTMPSREGLEAHISKVIVLAAAVEVTLRPAQSLENQESEPAAPPETVSLPWARRPFVAAKGVTLAPTGRAPVDPKARDAALAAIGKARVWVEEILAGASFAEIAKREGKCERQIRLLTPLAFAPPAMVQGLINSTIDAATVTELAKSMPLAWA